MSEKELNVVNVKGKENNIKGETSMKKLVKELKDEVVFRGRLLEVILNGKLGLRHKELAKIKEEIKYLELIKDTVEFCESKDNNENYRIDLDIGNIIESIDFQGAKVTYECMMKQAHELCNISEENGVDDMEIKVNVKKEDKKCDWCKLDAIKRGIKRREEEFKPIEHKISVFALNKGKRINTDFIYRNKFYYKATCSLIKFMFDNKKDVTIDILTKYACKYDKEFVDYVIENNKDLFIYLDSIKEYVVVD